MTLPAVSAIRNLIEIDAVGANDDAVHAHALYVAVAQVIPVVYAHVAPLSSTVSLTSARRVIDHLKYHVLPLIHVVPTLIYPVETVGPVVSNVIISLYDDDRFPAVSLYFTYTVFVPSPALHHAHA